MRQTLDIFQEICAELISQEQSNPVAKYIPPNQVFDQLDIALEDDPTEISHLKASLKEIVLSTPRTASAAFFNQLFGGRNDMATLGELLAVILNNSMYTYKAGGPMIAVEKEILNNICSILGWNQDSGGTIAPGGSMTNLMGKLMARDAFDPDIRDKGSRSGLVIYTSAECHYSIAKNAAFAGIGRDYVRKISADSHGKMIIEELRQTIQKDIADGLHPIMINATAGTTVLGAFDPFEDIAAICKEYNIWMHIDGAYCGSCIFSDEYKRLLAGASQANSFTLNAHKMLGTPLSCSIIVVKDETHLYQSFSNDASYLYQTAADDFNPGKVSLQCGRRNDALKFWTLWKSVGTKGLGKIVEKQFDLADYARKYIREHDDYTLYSYDDSISVCFNYKNIPAQKICTQLYEKEKLMVGYGSFREDTFIRLVTINYGNDKTDIDNFFRDLESYSDIHLS